RDALDEYGQRGERVLVREAVEVVEHDHRGLVQCGESAREPAENRVARGLWGGQALDDAIDVAADRAQHRGEVRDEGDGVVVELVGRVPADAASVTARPLRERGRLAVAGGSLGDEHPLVPRRGQPANRRAASDETAPGRRGPELRLEERELARDRWC